jgi:hypothetical protein
MEQTTITLKVNSTRIINWYVATVDSAIQDTERYMANLIRKSTTQTSRDRYLHEN